MGIELLLPAYALKSKEEAIAELKKNNLSEGALEQKCIVQQKNRELGPDVLKSQISEWVAHLERSISSMTYESLDIVADLKLDDLQ
jgi:hypothetical protein